MTDTLDLEHVLALEDDPAFLEIVCPTTDVLAWPTIRQYVFRSFLGDRLYETAPMVDFARPVDTRGMAVAAIRAAAHNLGHPARRSDVLLSATGAGLIPRGGRSFNRYIDYFADCLGDSAWTVEALYGNLWPAMPRANRRIGFDADRTFALAVYGRLAVRSTHRKLASELVDVAARRGRDLLGWELDDERRARLTTTAARRLAGYPAQARLVRRLLRRVKPRIVLVQDGSYGSMAVFNATAREVGVTVAEFQHGMITRGHDAYNVAPRLATSDAYRLTQPAAFLGYGAWWNDQFNAPIERRLVVGNPHRTETLRTWQAELSRATVLVLGDGIETDAYLAFCRRLAALLPPNLQVSFRPHPLERAGVRRDGVVPVDDEADLYASLGRTHAVIGEASTALFEAVGLVPRIFVWDTAKSRFYLGDHPFERFVDAEGLATRLASESTGVVPGHVADSMWADDWRGRFLRFISDRD